MRQARSEMGVKSALMIAKSWARLPVYIDPNILLSNVLRTHGYAAYTQVLQAGLDALIKRTGATIPCHFLICPADPGSNNFTLNLTAAKLPGETTLSSFNSPQRIHPLAEKE
jgi:hypothetical protein